MIFSVLRTVSLYSLVLIFIACNNQKRKDAADFFLKGNTAFNQNNYAEAIRLYDEAIDKNPEFADAFLNKGICLLKINRPKDAHEVLSKAIDLDPTLVQANLVRSETSLRLGDLNGAEQDLHTITKSYKDSSRYYLLHGNLEEARNNEASALADYDHALKLNSANVEALVNRGAVYYGLQSYADAKKDFLKAAKLNPSQTEALNNLGLIATKESKWTQAISYFDLILDRNPSDPLALNNKGYVFLMNGKPDEAKKMIEQSLEILPENGYALRNLGIYFQQANRLTEALSVLNQAIAIAEHVEMLYGITGQIYFAQKNPRKACEIWGKGKLLKDSLSLTEWAKNCR